MIEYVHEDKEADVVRNCILYLETIGCEINRTNSGLSFRGHGANKYAVKGAKAGTADITGCCPNGLFIAVECKHPTGGRLRPEQAEYLSRIAQMGGIALTVHGVDELEAKLKEALNGDSGGDSGVP